MIEKLGEGQKPEIPEYLIYIAEYILNPKNTLKIWGQYNMLGHTLARMEQPIERRQVSVIYRQTRGLGKNKDGTARPQTEYQMDMTCVTHLINSFPKSLGSIEDLICWAKKITGNEDDPNEKVRQIRKPSGVRLKAPKQTSPIEKIAGATTKNVTKNVFGVIPGASPLIIKGTVKQARKTHPPSADKNGRKTG